MTIYHSKNIKFYIPLNRKEVLERVSPLVIFERYLGKKVSTGVTYHSPFRKDSRPSFSFYVGNSKFRYIDFSTGESGDCFDFVMKMYGCTFKEALELINQDFNLGLGGEIKVALERKYESPLEKKEKPLIQIKTKKYTDSELGFWKQFNITKEILNKYNVFSVQKFWINKKLIGIRKENDPIFAYFFPNTKHIKVYKPLSTNKAFKWVGNTDRNDIQGLDQLKYSSDKIILTSSLKDVMVLSTLGFESIALNSEGSRPTKELLQILDRYKERYILYDNDKAGISYARTLREQIPNLKLLEVLDDKTKDPSDFTAIYGIEKLRLMLNTQL